MCRKQPIILWFDCCCLSPPSSSAVCLCVCSQLSESVTALYLHTGRETGCHRKPRESCRQQHSNYGAHSSDQLTEELHLCALQMSLSSDSQGFLPESRRFLSLSSSVSDHPSKNLKICISIIQRNISTLVLLQVLKQRRLLTFLPAAVMMCIK